jgi:hypothetical protein
MTARVIPSGFGRETLFWIVMESLPQASLY